MKRKCAPLLIFFLFPDVQSFISLHNDPGLEAECDGHCRLPFSCWVSGGITSSHCGGMFQYCCEEQPFVAQARKINFWTPIEKDVQRIGQLKELKYGPVINDPICGRPMTSGRRVVGGSGAGFGNFPWQALVKVGSSRCGGALISSKIVVTAGHCVHSASKKSIRVYLGEYSLYQSIEPLPRQKFVVSRFELHPYYQFTPQADRYDIALLILDKHVRYEPHISPVCLPETNSKYSEGTKAIVAGWGALKPDSPQRPRELQAVDVETIDNSKCELWHRHKRIRVRIFSDMLCAGYKYGGRDACQGDSGGPLMTKGPDGRWTLIGLVSAGYSCAKPKQPGIYHRVSKTADWISYHILQMS